jgi:hypothetical protein
MTRQRLITGAAAVVATAVTALIWPTARTLTDRVASIASSSFASWSLWAAAPVEVGARRFVGIPAAPLNAAPGGEAFATLYVSAGVVVADVANDAVRVSTQLWMHGTADEPGPLYMQPMGVEVGRLDVVPTLHAVAGTAVKGWVPVEIDGWLTGKAMVDDLGPIWATTEFDYQFACSDCHSPHAAVEYSSMQWGIIMARMGKMAKLRPEEALLILKWLQTTSAASDVRRGSNG